MTAGFVNTLRDVLPWVVYACLVYLVISFVAFLVHLLFGVLHNVRQWRQDRAADYDTLANSRFTIPVSVIMPAYNEEPVIVAAARSVLAFDYSKHEVILVNDGSRDGTLARLMAEFELFPVEVFCRRVLPCEEIRGVYRSARHDNLTVIDKVNGGKADALNAGVNFARYRYVLGVDGDSIYDRDALLKGMRLAVEDPAHVVCVTSLLAIHARPEQRIRDGDTAHPLDMSLLGNFQHMDYLRCFLNNRSAWTLLRYMLCAVGAFMIWRRDLLIEMGGFSRNFTCEDIEMTFRVQERHLREGKPMKLVALPDTVAMTEGPNRIWPLIVQRARWQRVILETVWHYRRMLFNPRYGTVGMIGMPFYVLSECLAPLFEVAAVLSLVLALAFGLLDWPRFLMILGTITFANAFLTCAALLGQDQEVHEVRFRDLVRLVLLSPLELFLYRPWLMVARVKGVWDLVRGDKSWHKFERNHRQAAPTAA